MEAQNFPYLLDSFPLLNQASSLVPSQITQFPCSYPIDIVNATLPSNIITAETRRKTEGKKNKSKVVPHYQRVAFHTRSEQDVLDDGYKWRKYGQKSVKNSSHPRSYYCCTHHACGVKKQIQRLSKDTGIIVTTYEGIHNHPNEKLLEALSPLLNQLQFLYTI